METATLAGGCFWCTEAIFQRLKGVASIVSGYANSNKENPSYEQVSTEATDAAEAIQITFNPKIISFETLLEVFWHLHDPTTLNQQGADVGTQYRSAIFYMDQNQKKVAEDSLKNAQKNYQDKIVTEIIPLRNLAKAEGYHQNYYNQNKSAGYCRIVIDPKITKLYKEFPNLAVRST